MHRNAGKPQAFRETRPVYRRFARMFPLSAHETRQFAKVTKSRQSSPNRVRSNRGEQACHLKFPVMCPAI
jgi:hypothetical protein